MHTILVSWGAVQFLFIWLQAQPGKWAFVNFVSLEKYQSQISSKWVKMYPELDECLHFYLKIE